MSLARYAAKLAALLGSDGKVPAAALSFTALNAANNLSDIANAVTALGNLGIGYTAISDFNAAIAPGFYRVPAVSTNAPFASANGSLLVIAQGDTLVQFYIDVYTSGSAWYRYRNSSASWSGWRRFTLLDEFPSSFAGNGYQKFPTGAIIQWGTGTLGANTRSVISYPITFPNAGASLVASSDWSSQGGNGWSPCGGCPNNSSSGIIWNTDDATRQVWWIATGY